MTTRFTPQRLGLFVSGYRWSGSSAVKDWLEEFQGVGVPPGTDISDGEIKALNYGLQNLLLIAGKNRHFGERLARFALCPDQNLWPRIFGPTLYRAYGAAAPVLRLWDFLAMIPASRCLRPGIRHYPALLNTHLGREYSRDQEYLEIVSQLVQMIIKPQGEDVLKEAEDSDLSRAVSRLVALFYDRQMSGLGLVPVFDNAISGPNCMYFPLINSQFFPRQFIFLVYRDPRDQFAEQVRYSPKNCSWMVNSFIHEYKKNYAQTMEFLHRHGNDPARTIRLISFESFILDAKMRRELSAELEREMERFSVSSQKAQSGFDPQASRANIGIWKKTSLTRQMQRIATELKSFLRPEAD